MSLFWPVPGSCGVKALHHCGPISILICDIDKMRRRRCTSLPLAALAVLAHAGALRAAEPVADTAPDSAKDSSTEGEDVHALDAIVVTGSRTERPLGEAPVATEVISREEIDESGAQNVGELLEERPGVQIDRGFAGAAPRLQGLPADYTLVLVDGVRQPGRIDGVIDLDRFSIEDIERVEIVRGSSSALYGSDAIAGVINIITRRAKKPLDIDATGSYGAYHTIDLSASVGTNQSHWSTRFSGGGHKRDAFDLDPSDVATSQSASTQYNVSNQTTFAPMHGMTLSLTGDYRHQDREAVDVSEAGGAVFDRNNRTETASFLLSPEWKLDDGSRLQLRTSLGIFRDQFLLDQRDSNDLDELQDTHEQLAQIGGQWDTLLGSEQLITIGVEGSYESLRTGRLVDGSEHRERAAVYVQDEWTVLGAPALVLLPGARLDVDSQFGAYPTPRIALRFDPIDTLTLRLGYGWGFKAPDFRELYLLFENPSVGYLVEGNTELKPEKSRNANAGVEYRPHRSVWLSVQAFYNVLSDRIGTDLVSSTDDGPQRFQYENVDSATNVGVETNLRLSPFAGLRFDLGYSWTHTENEADGQPLSVRPLHRATASIRYREDHVGFETLWRAAFVGSRPFYDDANGDGVSERQDASAYASLDARIAQRVGFGLRTFLSGENLLNAGDARFLPIAPRTFSGGIQLDY
jgi:outer membrane receptor for ferrienterochelin and colicins